MGTRKEIEEQTRDFRVNLIREMPFYGELLSRFDIKESRAVASAGTDGRGILYNQKYFGELNEGERNYVLMHELLHIILQHPYRAAGKNEKIWNVASDYVVNALLDDLICRYNLANLHRSSSLWLTKPECGCFMTCYSGESVEELYHGLYEKNKKRLKKFGKMLLQVEGKFGEEQLQEFRPEDLDLICGMKPEEADILIDQLKGWTKTAMKNWSNDPSVASLKQQLYILDNARILPWKTILKRFLKEYETTEVSYDHPERKYLHMDLILPGEGRDTEDDMLEDVWAFIDTSGSISQDDKNAFITQLYRICKQFHAKINIGYWDVEMHEVYRDVSDVEIVHASTGHSGGTDANAVYDYLEKNRVNASVIMILTDGYFDQVEAWRIAPYKKKTIVVLSDSGFHYCSEMGKIAKL
ncbi:MAG: VWA-like domain-containing protein [Lachnospiraceae bacterium]|nr:VWA-like domain-containing protein [Lachnospiraceae bacterium]